MNNNDFQLTEIRIRVALLSLCQAFAMACMMVVVAMAGVASMEVMNASQLSTLPVSILMLGTMIAIVPASYIQGKIGRKKGFIIGNCLGILGGLVIEFGMSIKSFPLLVVGSFLVGTLIAFSQYYRFAVVENTPESMRAKAISFVLLGGVIAGFLGPNIAKYSENFSDLYAFFGAGYAITIMSVFSIVILFFLNIKTQNSTSDNQTTRSFFEIISQPKLIIAVIIGAVAYGLMTMIMNGTPVAMVLHSLSFSQSATIIQWHIVAMFLPSLFTGSLIQKFGLKTIISAGFALILISIAAALAGTTIFYFAASAILVGLGWNFLYVGGTTLLTQTYENSEKTVVQAFNDFTLFAANIIGAFFAGFIVLNWGWENMAYIALAVFTVSVITILVIYNTRQTTTTKLAQA